MLSIHPLEGDGLALGGEGNGGVSGLDPRTGILGVVVDEDAVLADVVDLAAGADDADEPLGGDLGDVAGEPLDLAGLAGLVGGLGEDVDGVAGGDEVADDSDIGGEGLESGHSGGLKSGSAVGSIRLVEVSEDAVHIEVVSHCECPFRFFLSTL